MSNDSVAREELEMSRSEIRDVFVDAMIGEVLAEASRLRGGGFMTMTPEMKAETEEAFGGAFDRALPEVNEAKWVYALLPLVCKCREASGHLVACHAAAQDAFRSFVKSGLLSADEASLEAQGEANA